MFAILTKVYWAWIRVNFKPIEWLVTMRESDSYSDGYSILLLDEIPFIPFFSIEFIKFCEA